MEEGREMEEGKRQKKENCNQQFTHTAFEATGYHVSLCCFCPVG